MKLLTKSVLSNLLAQFKNIFGLKSVLDKNIEDRRQYLLEIDYEKELAFSWDLVSLDTVFEAPVQESEKLKITQVYNVFRNGNILEVE